MFYDLYKAVCSFWKSSAWCLQQDFINYVVVIIKYCAIVIIVSTFTTNPSFRLLC
jgi:hypothetical protein